MDIGKAFGAVHRTVLWTSLYKKGVPIQTIHRIRRGREKTTLQAKYNRQYGGGGNKQYWSFPRVSNKCATLHHIPTRYDERLSINKLHTKIPYRTTSQRNEQSKLNTPLQKYNKNKHDN